MAQRSDSRQSRVLFGVLVLLITAGLTVLRARATREPLEQLTEVTRLHAEGKASDVLLANAQYHGAHAQRRFDSRWSLSGYAMQALIGTTLGLALVVVRRRKGAG